MKMSVRDLLESMDSMEITRWQVFFDWRAEDQRRRRKEREFMGDDDEVIHW